ncbi:MAG: hypothetical protein ABL927_02615 [Bdellovibrionales bacterium]
MAKDLKTKILVVCNSKANFENSLRFFDQQEWVTIFVDRVEEVFRTISLEKPNFIFISVNLNTPKILQLPKLIRHISKEPIIAFTEENSLEGMKLINEIEVDHKIQGKIANEDAFRKIRKIVRKSDEKNEETFEKIIPGIQEALSEPEEKIQAEKNKAKLSLVSSTEQDQQKSFKEFQELKNFIYETAKSCIKPPSIPVKPVQESKVCMIWPMRNKNKDGIIIIAHSGPKSESEEFNSKFIDNLRSKENQNEHKSEIVVDEHFQVNMDSIDITSEAEGEAFYALFNDGGSEVAVKLLDYEIPQPKMDYIDGENKFKISVHDLVPDLPQGTDVYLFLPKNKKYFMYLKKGGLLTTRQKNKLVEAKTEIYINEDQAKDHIESHRKNKFLDRFRKDKKAA